MNQDHHRNRMHPFAWFHDRTAGGDATSEQILATHARTSFNFAARFLPPHQRRCATDLYAFFRTLDDLVDESAPGVSEATVRGELNAWRVWLDSPRTSNAPREPLGVNLARVIESCGISIDIFHHMLDGLEDDLGPRELEDEAALHTYCYQVASTVGYAMAHVLGATSTSALSAAEQLGAAMQLTNILRDVGEDLDADRVYLPRTILAHYGLCRTDLEHMRHGNGPDERFRALMTAEIARAHALYDDAQAGIWLLPPDCRLPILIASRLYRRLLPLIEANEYDTLRQRAATTRFQKAREAAVCGTLVWRGRHLPPATNGDGARSAVLAGVPPVADPQSAMDMRGD